MRASKKGQYQHATYAETEIEKEGERERRTSRAIEGLTIVMDRNEYNIGCLNVAG